MTYEWLQLSDFFFQKYLIKWFRASFIISILRLPLSMGCNFRLGCALKSRKKNNTKRIVVCI